MKKIFLLLSLLIFSVSTFSQIHDPVKWSTSVENISDSEYDLIIQATIDNGWHLYSQKVPDNGPIATTFVFEKNENYELVGNTSEEKGHTTFDSVFEMEIKYFENKTVFKQRIKTLTKNASVIIGEVEFMVCDDTSCLPPTFIDLNFQISDNKPAAIDFDKKSTEETTKVIESKKKDKSSNKSLLTIFIIAFFSGFAAHRTSI